RLFIYENMDAFRDYRDILNKDQRVDTTGMRPMGAAESNMNLFSRRLKKIGCSWSLEGLKRMLNALIHHFEGTLVKQLETHYLKTVSLTRNPKNTILYLLIDRENKSIHRCHSRAHAGISPR